MESKPRLFLSALTACAVLAACSGNHVLPGGSSNAAALEFGRRMPLAAGNTTVLTFVNNNKTYPSTKIWFSYYGLDPVTGKGVHLVDAKGTVAPNKVTSTPTTALEINVGSSKTFIIPQFNAGRMHFSFGKPLYQTVAANGLPTELSAGGADPNDKNNYKTPWDFAELTYIPQAGTTGLFNFNLSRVQSTNLPMQWSVSGQDASSKKPVSYTHGWASGGFTKFLMAIKANASSKGLVIAGPNRIMAPGTAIVAFDQKVIPKSVFSATYFDAYTAKVWSTYAASPLTFTGDPPAGSNKFVPFTATVKNGLMTFTTTQTALGLKPIVFRSPTTAEIFENNDFCKSGCGSGTNQQINYKNQIIGTLFAAFNRSVMLTTSQFANAANAPWCLATNKFYVDPTTNYYSKLMHANSLSKLAYAFQSDDHCNQSDFVSLINPTKFTITFHNQ
jgi:hypothetical protein